MASRLELLKNQLSTPKTNYVDSAFEYLRFPEFLTPEEEELRLGIRAFAEREIAPHINDHIERAAFPDFLLPKLKEAKFFENFLLKPYGQSRSVLIGCILAAEIARIDAGCATFCIVQYGLSMYTIEKLGSEEQKAKYLPGMKNCELISGWGLTEGKIGSDASSLETTVTKVPGGYKLNGDKRWIGNGNRDLLIVWAKNTENHKVEGFILDMKTPGITSQVIKYKLPLRVVQNCHIHFNNVIIPEDHKLPKATDFQKGTGAILKHSRVYVLWIAVGICLGVYDNTIKYIMNRKQFGVPIAAFQLMQEKLVRIQGNIQAMMLFAWRTTTMLEKGTLTMGQVGMAKAWISRQGREVCALGREMLGGNGITYDNYVMKAMADMEAIYTYEGTYDINALVAGRELTGIPAFKAGGKK